MNAESQPKRKRNEHSTLKIKRALRTRTHRQRLALRHQRAYLIVDDDVDRSPHGEVVNPRHLHRLIHHPLAGERRVSVDEDGHGPLLRFLEPRKTAEAEAEDATHGAVGVVRSKADVQEVKAIHRRQHASSASAMGHIATRRGSCTNGARPKQRESTA